ncbi:hypothetical protein [Buchnera aphidicola]|uniref:hypothetical protein n=1 Tax=Buchnera aphidicola TaxID=9 RepID=UPI00094C1619|nr:hypothetical protein [Buchnera aphidicola]
MSWRSIIHLKILDQRTKLQLPLFFYHMNGVIGLYLNLCVKNKLCIMPNQSELLSTGISLYRCNLEKENIQYLILPRAGLGVMKNIIFGNFINFLKKLNEGEVKLLIWNKSKINFYINSGEVIAQLVFISNMNISLNFIF